MEQKLLTNNEYPKYGRLLLAKVEECSIYPITK